MEIKEFLKKGDPTRVFFPGQAGVYSNFGGYKQMIGANDSMSKKLLFAGVTGFLSAIQKGIK